MEKDASRGFTYIFSHPFRETFPFIYEASGHSDNMDWLNRSNRRFFTVSTFGEFAVLAHLEPTRRRRFCCSRKVLAGTNSKPTATVTLYDFEMEKEATLAILGTGPVDAAYKAIDQLVGVSGAKLLEYSVARWGRWTWAGFGASAAEGCWKTLVCVFGEMGWYLVIPGFGRWTSWGRVLNICESVIPDGRCRQWYSRRNRKKWLFGGMQRKSKWCRSEDSGLETKKMDLRLHLTVCNT